MSLRSYQTSDVTQLIPTKEDQIILRLRKFKRQII